MSGFPGSPRSGRHFARIIIRTGAVWLAAALPSCSQLGVDPDAPASVELPFLPSPSVVIGDSLRNLEGAASPVRAIVRNLNGDPISDAQVSYIYAEFNRDSALLVDSETGYVFAAAAPKGEARIAARVGPALQVMRPIIVTVSPDSLTTDGITPVPELTLTLPDTSSSSARSNTSSAISVGVRHDADDGTTEPVRGWVVSFALVSPSNPTNDTSAAVFLVNKSGRASLADTTGTDGVASTHVRVRAAQFPSDASSDSVVLSATASYKGIPLKGAPIRLVLPVTRGASSGETRH